MSKERFTDKDLLMLKGLYHTSIAKQYFETAKIDQHFLIKHIFSNWVGKLHFILMSVMSMVEGESKKIYEEQITKGDTLFFDSLMDKLPNLSDKQRQSVELIVDGYLRGEEITFVDYN